jgi:hypothetical protein
VRGITGSDMQGTAAICAVIGHRWRIDDATIGDDDFEPLYCSRCGSRRPLGATPIPELMVNGPLVGKGAWPEAEMPHPHEPQQEL